MLLPVLGLAACAANDRDNRSSLGNRGFFELYKIEVVQGNVVTREAAEQLRAGLTRDQVRGLLGTPLLTDIFHADRWDYVFTIKRQGTEPQQRRLTVFFEGDRVARYEGGDLPSEQEFVDSIDVRRRNRVVPKLELSENELRAIPLPTGRPLSAAASASGPVRAYPPLEPATR